MISGGRASELTITKGKTADESVTLSTDLQDDNHLFFDVSAGETWVATFYLRTTFNASGQIKVGVNGPAMNFVSLAASLTPDAIVPAYGVADALDTAVPLVSALATGGLVEICLAVAPSASGTVVLRWAQNASNAAATTIKAGSYLVARKL